MSDEERELLFNATNAFGFRVKSGEHCGVVFASDFYGLFWAVDRYTDPYSCEILPISSDNLNRLSICYKETVLDDEIENSEYELDGFDIATGTTNDNENWLDLNELCEGWLPLTVINK